MIVPFADEHVDGAAALLAERHAAHRAAEPLLADGDVRAWVDDAWAQERTSGAVALAEGEVGGLPDRPRRRERHLGRPRRRRPRGLRRARPGGDA